MDPLLKPPKRVRNEDDPFVRPFVPPVEKVAFAVGEALLGRPLTPDEMVIAAVAAQTVETQGTRSFELTPNAETRAEP